MAHFIELPVVDRNEENEESYFLNTAHVVAITPRYEQGVELPQVLGAAVHVDDGSGRPWILFTKMLAKDVYFLTH